MRLAARVNRIKPSPTLAVTAKAQALRAEGRNIIGLGAGEPDFDTPDHIKQAAIDAIQAGFTKYTPVAGIPSLKEAITQKLKRDNRLDYTANQVIVSCGAKHSIYNAMQALLEPGDEVVIPAPYWVSYPDMTLLADAKPVIIETTLEQQFKLTPDALAKQINPKTKLLILNSPSNPTGVAYTQAELKALGEILREFPNCWILSDDIYEPILWSQEPFANILMACPELYERSIVINGVSKAYSMTGWRIGYAATASEALVKAMSKIQGQSTSNPCSIAQKAAEAALNGPQDCIQEMLKAFHKRHDYIVNELNTIPGIECIPGDGAFYAFPRVSQLIEKIPNVANDTELAEFLINEAEIALVPGAAFGAPGYVRLSFATSMEILQEAMQRLKNTSMKYT